MPSIIRARDPSELAASRGSPDPHARNAAPPQPPVNIIPDPRDAPFLFGPAWRDLPSGGKSATVVARPRRLNPAKGRHPSFPQGWGVPYCIVDWPLEWPEGDPRRKERTPEDDRAILAELERAIRSQHPELPPSFTLKLPKKGRGRPQRGLAMSQTGEPWRLRPGARIVEEGWAPSRDAATLRLHSVMRDRMRKRRWYSRRAKRQPVPKT